MFDWITTLVQKEGYVGIFPLMTVEHVFAPIPSELIMPLAGYSAARDALSLPLIILSGSLGSLLATTLWFIAGYRIGRRRMDRLVSRRGRWVMLSCDDLDRTEAWFNRHGPSAVLFGRFVPTVRTLISVPAGIARMSVATFMLYTATGSVGWTAALAIAGYALDSRYAAVGDWVNPLSCVIGVGIVLLYLYRVLTYDGSSTVDYSDRTRDE